MKGNHIDVPTEEVKAVMLATLVPITSDFSILGELRAETFTKSSVHGINPSMRNDVSVVSLTYSFHVKR